MNLDPVRSGGVPRALRDLPALRRFGPPLGAALLFGMALLSLHLLLRDVHYREVVASLRGLSRLTVGLSLGATLAGYAALVGYDWSALRYVGRRVPLPRLVLASFCAYALGNTTGFAVFAGGAVRYRIYGAIGLDAGEIARISVFCATAFGVGIGAVGFAALAIRPEVLASAVGLAPSVLRGIGVAGMLLGVLALGWRARLPSGSRARARYAWIPRSGVILGQLAFSVLDIGLAATALYVVIPGIELPFLSFVSVFALATVAGVVSHVPGGLGVFEGVLIAALGEVVPTPALAAGLVAYRAIYYLVPLLVALVLLAMNELSLAARAGRWRALAQRVAPLGRAGASVVPFAMSTMVLIVGSGLLLNGVLPLPPARLEDVRAVMSLNMFEISRLLASVAGALLVVLSRALSRRVRSAFWIVLAVLLVTAGEALAEGFDLELAAALLLAASLLGACHREFYRPSRLSRHVLSPGWLLTVGAILLGVAWVLFFAYKSVPYRAELWWQFAFDAHAPRALRVGLAAGVTLVVFALSFALRPPWGRPAAPQPRDLDDAQAVVAAQDDPDAGLALVGDKSLLFSDSRASFVMYAVQGRSWVTLGGPVGPAEERRDLLAEFLDLADASGGRIAMYQVAVEQLTLCLDAGLTLNKLGEEAVVALESFSLAGRERKDLRYALSRGERDGLAFELIPAPADDSLLDELAAISEVWLESKGIREKSFSVGRFDRAYLRRFPLAVTREHGRLSAFANVLVTDTRAGSTIDLMRHLPGAHPLTMDYLFTRLILLLKERGYGSFNLGMAPLSGLDGLHDSLWNRLGGLLYRHAGHFYHFAGLRRFKEKFRPEWRPRYLATERGLDPLVAATDIALLCGGGLRGVLGK